MDNGYRPDRRHVQRRKKHRNAALKRFIPLVIILIILVLGAVIFVSSGILDDLSYSGKRTDISAYITELSGAQVSDSEAIIVKDGQYTDGRVVIINGVPFISYDTVKSDYIPRFFRDKVNKRILYTNATETIYTEIGSSSYGVNGIENTLSVPTTVMRGETLYMSFDYLSLYMTLGYKLCGGNDGTPYRIEIYTEPLNIQTAALTADKAIRTESSKKADILVKPGEGAVVRLLNDNGGGSDDSDSDDSKNNSDKNKDAASWQKVMTDDMIVGYIEKKHISGASSEQISVNTVEPLIVPSNTRDKKIVLGWSYIGGQSGNDVIYGQLDNSPGMNVLSPTWFYLADNEGNIGSIASKDVVNACHKRDIEVWGMVDNFTKNDITTAYILDDTDKRKKVISQLISLAAEYNLDGINIDFESLPEEAGEPFIQFIRELSIECRANNLVLSVDNNVPKPFTMHYNRKEQGIFADYVIIMGYDEHTNGSEEIGSVASIGFVKEGIEKTLEEVPADKVINALPFYARLWKIHPAVTVNEVVNEAGETEYENAEGYEIDEVQALPLQQALDTVKSHSNATTVWDETTMQNYAEWGNESKKTCIWLEDAQSLDCKLQVMASNNIAGAAVWQIGYGEPFAWEVINKYY